MIKIIEIPSIGFLREPTVLIVVPVSKSTWHDGIRRGIYPKPYKLSDGTTGYCVQEIRELINKIKDARI